MTRLGLKRLKEQALIPFNRLVAGAERIYGYDRRSRGATKEMTIRFIAMVSGMEPVECRIPQQDCPVKLSRIRQAAEETTIAEIIEWAREDRAEREKRYG